MLLLPAHRSVAKPAQTHQAGPFHQLLLAEVQARLRGGTALLCPCSGEALGQGCAVAASLGFI